MKIVYVTGSRSEYGVMKELLMRMNKDFQLSLIVTGMHLLEAYGSTIDEIRKDGLAIEARVDMRIDTHTTAGMAKSVGYGIIGIADCLAKNRPDLVMVTGDRGEMLSAAIAAAHLNIPIAHISGGDVTAGTIIDERVRHAITKFADIHFPSNENSARVIISSGENPELVFPVGNPGIPSAYSITELEKKEIMKKYKLNPLDPVLIVLQHPVSSQVEMAGSQMHQTMRALETLAIQAIVVYPNSDAGSDEMIHVINSYKHGFLHVYKSIERDDFLKLMACVSVMLGNSSSALLEAPSFKLPAVNIGVRQQGRERSNNIIDAPNESSAIVAAVRKALSPSFREQIKPSPYMKEDPEGKIISILKQVDLKRVIRMKRSE